MVVVATPQLSAVVGDVKITVAVHNPESVLVDTAAAQVMLGTSASVTVTVCEQLFVFPFTSVTVQVTTVVPNEYVEDA